MATSTTATALNPANAMTMAPVLTENRKQVVRIWQRVFGSMPIDLRKIGATNNDVFAIRHRGEDFFLKLATIGQQQLLDIELRVIKFLHRNKLPAPEIVSSSIEPVERSWMVLRHAGFPVASVIHKRPDLLRGAGSLLAVYHQADTFGLQKALLSGAVDRRRSFRDRLNRLVTRAMQIAGTGLLEKSLISKVVRCLENYQPSGTPVLCHGEFSLPHVLAGKHGVTTAVDWPYCEPLPAAADIALIEIFCRLRDLNFLDFLDGYGRSASSYFADPDRIPMLMAHIVRQLVPGRRNFEACRNVLNEFADRI
ncbi:MAG: aminoglycoside phosphotransferase family protein [Planctomycetota bacterium]